MKKALILAAFLLPFSAFAANSTIYGTGHSTSTVAYFCLNGSCTDVNGNPVTVVANGSDGGLDGSGGIVVAFPQWVNGSPIGQ